MIERFFLPAKNSAGKKQPADEFRHRHEISRIEAFSDVVFGFSLTLLVVSLEVPRTFTQLLADMRGFVPFAICFALLAQVWWLHHNFFRRYGLDDATTAVLNFILLFVVLFYTYPLKFLFTGLFNQVIGNSEIHESGGKAVTWIQADQAPMLMAIYGLGYAAVFFIFVLLYRNALRLRDQLELTELEVFDTKTSMVESGFHVFIGVLCAGAAAAVPPSLGGLTGFLYFLIPVGMTVIGSRRGAARRRLQSALAANNNS
jgi:uncharacterized membrane protein